MLPALRSVHQLCIGFVGFLALAAAAEGSQIDPGTPLDGTDPGGAILVGAINAPVGAPDLYSARNDFIQLGDFVGPVDRAEAGDIVLLADPAAGETPSNWAAVARFFNPADLMGTKGLDATEVEGFLPASSPTDPTDFSKFSLLPNVLYISGVGFTSGPAANVVTATYTEFGPAGAFISGQSEIIILTVTSSVPEPCAFASLGMIAIGCLVLSRRRFLCTT